MNDLQEGCTHPVIQGDNYGETCMVCGAQLAGWGFWGEGDGTCHHHYMPVGDYPPDQAPAGKDLLYVCIYCEDQIIRPATWPAEKKP